MAAANRLAAMVTTKMGARRALPAAVFPGKGYVIRYQAVDCGEMISSGVRPYLRYNQTVQARIAAMPAT